MTHWFSLGACHLLCGMRCVGHIHLSVVLWFSTCLVRAIGRLCSSHVWVDDGRDSSSSHEAVSRPSSVCSSSLRFIQFLEPVASPGPSGLGFCADWVSTTCLRLFIPLSHALAFASWSLFSPLRSALSGGLCVSCPYAEWNAGAEVTKVRKIQIR